MEKLFLSRIISTRIFFAPAHSYDKNTVRALSANGFKYVSDGKSPMPYNWHGVTFFPVINQGAARIGGKKYYTSIFHAHEWARDDKCKDYYDLKNTLENYALYISPFDNYSKQLVFSLALCAFMNEDMFFGNIMLGLLLSELSNWH